MRILVCGDRNWTNRASIERELRKVMLDTCSVKHLVIEGEARGADSLARDVAIELGMVVAAYPAEWEKYGRGAGPIRNRRMLVEGKPDLVLAFHPNIEESKGTKNMVAQARAAGVEVRVFNE